MPAKTYGTSLEWRARRVAFRGLPSTDRSHKKGITAEKKKKTTDKIEARPASLKRKKSFWSLQANGPLPNHRSNSRLSCNSKKFFS